MSPSPARPHVTEQESGLHTQLCAFNSAFAELGLRFRWDAATLYALAAIEGEAARIASYIQTHHPHLLNAYSIDFLCEAILGRKNAQAPGEWRAETTLQRAAPSQQAAAATHDGWDWSEPGLPALAGA
ncbi:hypothetical protein [Paraburkholderia sp. Ac-20347]|uniref:hypothetical protein n=1 Tax=Paraburkholderia sp. Ac-20347 TaxID=2703892 RepID=UPI00198125AB|nr:hypothetical protein [Paraburkholderia sp. Ac-20347]MBN3809733.1 hypothetical protein [Paraburkholderia sp. Ac-20347]